MNSSDHFSLSGFRSGTAPEIRLSSSARQLLGALTRAEVQANTLVSLPYGDDRARARACAHEVVREVSQARELARQVSALGPRDLALIRDIDCVRFRAEAFATRLDWASSRTRIGRRDWALSSSLKRSLVRVYDRALDVSLAHAFSLAGSRDRALLAQSRLKAQHARALERARDYERLLAESRDARQAPEASQVREAEKNARSAVSGLGSDRDTAGGFPPGRARQVTPSASRILAGTARLLPRTDRARYSEEYAAELWEIAQTGAGRSGQFKYAARQTLHVMHLRGAVRAPRRRRASS
jgi:hypothetical protein